MPYNPAGLFSLIASYFATPGATIRTEQHNPVFEDVASALSSVLLRDGRAPMTGTLNMNGFPISNVATGSTPSSVATLAQAMPIGAVIDFAGSSAPAGWALCYGQAVSRTTYAALFALIGTTYGVGDGSTTFNLPDARGRTVAGYDVMGGVAASRLTGAFAAGVGVQSIAIALSNLPNVVPSFSGISTPVTVTTVDGGIANGSISNSSSGGGAQQFQAFNQGSMSVAPRTSTGNVVPQGSVGSINGGVTQTLQTLVQPTLILNKIIKVSYDA